MVVGEFVMVSTTGRVTYWNCLKQTWGHCTGMPRDEVMATLPQNDREILWAHVKEGTNE